MIWCCRVHTILQRFPLYDSTTWEPQVWCFNVGEVNAFQNAMYTLYLLIWFIHTGWSKQFKPMSILHQILYSQPVLCPEWIIFSVIILNCLLRSYIDRKNSDGNSHIIRTTISESYTYKPASECIQGKQPFSFDKNTM